MLGRTKRSRQGSTASRRGVATFALSSLAALLVLGVVGVLVVERTGTSEAIRDAKELARLAGDGIVQPSLTAATLRGDPGAQQRLDTIVRRRVLRDPVVRVKVWTAAGRIVYSDEHSLIGSVYPLREDERNALRSGRVAAEVSDLNRPENRLERRYGKLLEVYLPIVGPRHTRLLFETYQRFGSISSSSHRFLRAFAPALIGALVLLWLIQVPLAARLARRLEESQLQREALLQRAIQSSDLERRRVARDLHDGAVQNLAGIAWSLSATAAESPPHLAESLEQCADETRRTIKELRSLLVEIYPPDLHRTGLEAALGDLVATLENRGINGTLELPADVSLAANAERLIFRVTQEALRNTIAHAEAHNVEVDLRTADHETILSVIDDGRGFAPKTVNGSHFGLRMLRDLARDAGAEFEVTSRPDAGTTIRLTVPVG